MHNIRIRNCRCLYVDSHAIWIAKGMTFWGVNENAKRITKKYTVGSLSQRIISSVRFLRQLLREGIHHLLALNNGNILVCLKKKIITLDQNGKVLSCFEGFVGNKPAHRGICLTPEGSILFGEYSVNIKNQNASSVYRSDDNGLSFQKVYTFNKDQVRHIHFVQWDKYENCLWMGTGDKDHECMLLRSIDDGESWSIVGHGSQIWRAISIAITPEAIYWGTDAGSVSEANFIAIMNRKTRKIDTIKELPGPAHSNTYLSNGDVYISTGVEGGENEKDKFARLYKVELNGKTTEILKLKKDCFPNIVQYGVIRFPLGLEDRNKLAYTTYALQSNPEICYIEK